MSGSRPLVEHLIDQLAARRVHRIFGVPGGGSSLDVIAAARARGIDFVLARHEASAAIMALATSRIDDAPGVVLTTIGPGVANAANGIACASLDRAPLLLITDGIAPTVERFVTHQVFDQRALTAPIVKGHSRLDGDDAVAALARLLDLASTPPHGPVHIELTGEAARRHVADGPASPGARPGSGEQTRLDAARTLLERARRPVLVVGLEASTARGASAARRLAQALACPVFTTYQAKGVVPDIHPGMIGLFTGGSLEGPLVDAADLVVLLGVDPVELIPRPWPYRAPVLDIGLVERPVQFVAPTAAIYDDLDRSVSGLGRLRAAEGWSPEELASHRRRTRERLGCAAGDGVSPQRIVTLAQDAVRAGPLPRITIDAGAHMFSATAFWACGEPNDLLISNGLATMGFALPAAIGASLADPGRPVIAFTGDGGLAICLGELLTAIEQRARIIVVVFNDGALSLIDIKQQARGLPRDGVRWNRADFAGAAAAFGFSVWRARTEAEYGEAMTRALGAAGPCLIDVRVDPVGYADQLTALRG